MKNLDCREKTVKSKTGRGSRKGEAEAVGWMRAGSTAQSPVANTMGIWNRCCRCLPLGWVSLSNSILPPISLSFVQIWFPGIFSQDVSFLWEDCKIPPFFGSSFEWWVEVIINMLFCLFVPKKKVKRTFGINLLVTLIFTSMEIFYICFSKEKIRAWYFSLHVWTVVL